MKTSGLLAASGLALAMVVALAKAALLHGLAPLDFAAGSSAGAALLMAPLGARAAAVRVHRPGWLPGCALLSGVSYALPNLSQAWVAGHVGAGHASMMLALTPLITLAFALLLGVERPRGATLAGLLLGLAGTWLLLAPRAGADAVAGAGLAGLLLGLVAPSANAAGNLIRARLLPAGEPPVATVWAMLVMAGAVLLPLALAGGALQRLTLPGAAAVAASAGTTVAFNLLLFRLQAAAGPVRLSQVGYVAGLIGVGLSALLFGEPLRWQLGVAAALIVAGVRLVGRPMPLPAR